MLQHRTASSGTVLRSTWGTPSIVPRSAVSKHRLARMVPHANRDGSDTAQLAVGVAGLISNPIVLFSLYTLKTTGEGVPPGPGGIFGALEGISYLVIVGIVAWSLKTKLSTGSGLPAGPSGLLGASEGISYLSIVIGLIVFLLTFLDKGSLPGPLGY